MAVSQAGSMTRLDGLHARRAGGGKDVFRAFSDSRVPGRKRALQAESAAMDFHVVVLPGAFAASVAASLDVLEAARAIAARAGAAAPRFRVVGPQAGLVTLGNGMQVAVDALPARRSPGRPLWLLPGLGIADADGLRAFLAGPHARATADCLREAHARGHAIAASCAAVLLLGAAGLLEGRRATCTWWLADELRRLAPGCEVDARRMVIEDRGLFTAGAAMAHLDLMLAVLRHRCGRPLAERVAQALLIDGRPSQGRFAHASVLALGDPLAARVEALVREAMPAVPSVAELAARLSMSTRTLHRRLHAATGRPPVAFVQSVRLAVARSLLQSQRLAVERVAERVGYQDAASLRRLLRRALDATPSELRR
jgi:transcriptional regulator GlxA family with amidase domain